ncbi:phage N-6-adenine-methyltransferase [archaeon]|nr:phage N-6-adenine-methyltransferase [archaeon]
MSRTELSLSDEWETQQKLYDQLCKKYDIDPKLDVSATSQNTKCLVYMDEKDDALQLDWMYFGNDVWCNPPHSKTKQFVLKAHEQWMKHDINIMMLVPLQTLGRKYFNDIFDNYITPKKGTEWHRVQPRPVFTHPDQEKQENAKQEYVVLIWRTQIV